MEVKEKCSKIHENIMHQWLTVYSEAKVPLVPPWHPRALELSYCHTMQKSRNITGQNRSPIFFICVAKNVVENYRKIIEILHGRPFEGWPNRAPPFYLFWQKSADWLNWPCPVRSALKRTPVQDFYCFSIMFYYIFSNTYQKIGDLFCRYISGLSHSVN